MLLLVVAFIGGAFTVLSPCILPVVPFVFARPDQPFVTGRLPMLIGLAGTFALLTGLGAAGLNGAAQLSEYGRYLALALFAVFGAALLFPALAARLARPLTALADRFVARSARQGATGQIGSALLLGAATGLLWAPCAGPVLGLILTGAVRHGVTWQTWAALGAYAVGAACSLAIAASLGKRAMDALKRSMGLGEHLRRAAGALVLVTVGAIAFGVDTRVLAHLPGSPTESLENRLTAQLGAKTAEPAAVAAAVPAAVPTVVRQTQTSAAAHVVRVATSAATAALPVEGTLPSLDGASTWLNSAPLTPQDLRGKVVVVNFWTYSCINCLRTLPYLKTWAQRYQNDGLVVVGVHTPEFGFEHNAGNVKRALADLGIRYPVALDNDYRVWNAFGNAYWPAFYVVDAQGRVRYHHFGEGSYGEAEQAIRQLLAENGRAPAAHASHASQVEQATGAQVPADLADTGSGETYLGYREGRGFASPQSLRADTDAHYTLPADLPLNAWALDGRWNIGAESAVSAAPQAAVAYRFHARDLHLVLAPAADGKPVRFRITIDGAAPGAAHGADAAADGTGVVTGARLYQLVRQGGAIGDRTFEIRFLDPGVKVYTFTFG
ncbi:cytochrome c biogenesis protein CcdA/thiol-disulfide isomerase/thioredoxin [Paraburkholderia bannensis]|uniref:Cytochrome c biogenesis protein CcdA/thiol-disulfide isomerase/thioredoxin n=1 Tax=Paraburkholderia bannensis TaxID=765414 RepID=A0A7W9TZM4_9BURK|nr:MULTISPECIES: cytochrome c biogenesis protein DipZ [Paraburkholderia]MBB3259327.1 cytochrome c biogenesis protein CcdA/thiol-disulfide isomerase/thioredoxin [Paraburkholderia sp. WP4_3_2]MBB6104343.1 cytochrome c biogenesis protein CcdA/thiol-disulfide isomerase/thioredoxin [Paraburkholderia bannensis]